MLTKNHVHSCASTLALAVLLSCAGLGHPAAQTHSPPAGRFEGAFGNRGRVEPTFTRPDVTRRLPSLPNQADESAPAPRASGIPPENSQAQGRSENTQKKGVLSTLKKVLVPSAKANSSPTLPPPEARPPASEPQATAAVPVSRKQPVVTRRLPDRQR